MKHIPAISLLLATLAALSGCRGGENPAAVTTVAASPHGTVSDAGAAAFPMTVTDVLGVPTEFDAPPTRIISLAPNLTEILFAIGAGDLVVGRTSYCRYPPETADIEVVGGYVDPNIEKIISLAPDLVLIARGTATQYGEKIRNHGTAVLTLDPATYEEVAQNIETLGAICGLSPEAAEAAFTMRARLEAVKEATASIPPEQRPRVLAAVWLDPLFVAGPGGFLDDMLQAAGAVNAASSLAAPFDSFSMEAVVAADPQVLVVALDHAALDESSEEYLAKLHTNRAWKNVSAVREGRIVCIDADLVGIPGPRLAHGLEQMAQGIHPDLFPTSHTRANQSGQER